MTTIQNSSSVAQAYGVDYALNTLGWKAFQDLCAQICEEKFGRTVLIYREAQDGGQDAMFLAPAGPGFEEVTIQCKFSSKGGQRLRASDIAPEIESIERLVAEGRAGTYYFITSLGIDNGVALAIRSELIIKGVKEPYVLGREWITQQIRNSPRLRALVPRVYGLGDLSAIIDERSGRFYISRAMSAYLSRSSPQSSPRPPQAGLIATKYRNQNNAAQQWSGRGRQLFWVKERNRRMLTLRILEGNRTWKVGTT